MGTIADKLEYLNQTKADIKQALIDKGVVVEDTDTFRSYATKINEIKSGDGSGIYNIKVIDYDGTILKNTKLNTGDVFELPDPPVHNGLIFQEWSSPVNINNNTITVEDGNIIIGATYTTASGLSEFDITITKASGLEITLNMDGIKNWGDGVTDNLTTHTYSNYGDYTVTCDGTSFINQSNIFVPQGVCKFARLANVTTLPINLFAGSFALKNITISKGLTSIEERCFSSCYILTCAVIPSGVQTIGKYVFDYCSAAEYVVIPKSVTVIDSGLFSRCYSLKSAIIPDNVGIVNTATFYECFSLEYFKLPKNAQFYLSSFYLRCYSLKEINLPENTTDIGVRAFYECRALKHIYIPQGVTSIEQSAFSGCYSLDKIFIPKSVTNIATQCFQDCYGLIEIDCSDFDTPPTLAAKTAITSNNMLRILVKNENALNLFKNATNWVNFADYMYIKE